MRSGDGALRLLQECLVDNAARVGAYLLERLRELRQRHRAIGDVRGLGLMLAVDLVKDKATKEPDHELLERILYRAFEKGFVVLGCGDSSIRIAPPLIVTEEEADRAVQILARRLQAACACRSGSRTLWFAPNEVGGVTMMLPSDY